MHAKIERQKKEKPREFFLGFPKVARELGITQIALGGGEPTLDLDFLKKFGVECKKNNVVFNLTTNGTLFDDDVAGALTDATLISFSLDNFKRPSEKAVRDLFNKMDYAKKKGFKVGCNLLLDDWVVNNLYEVIAEVTRHAEFVYLLHPKPNTLKISGGIIKIRLMTSSVLFKNIFADNCSLLRLGMVKSCERGKRIVSVDPYGQASYCSFDFPAQQLNSPEDLVGFVRAHYPLNDTNFCPFV